MKKGIHILLWSFMRLVSIIMGGLALFVTYVMVGATFCSSGVNDQSKDVRIYVRSNGFHTDICMPVSTRVCDWRGFVDVHDYPKNRAFRYIAMGWGDRDFYIKAPRWEDVTVGMALNSLFVPTESAMHVEYMDYEPQKSEYCLPVDISWERYEKLTRYVEESFLLSNGNIQMVDETSYWGTDHFYASAGSYHMFETCNSWTNGALKIAGVRTAAWCIFPGTVMSYRK